MVQEQETYKLIEFLSSISGVVQSNFPDSKWVEAEISRPSGVGGPGHCYMDLVQLDESGNTIAQVSAHIWQYKNQQISQKFLNATGRFFDQGDKVRLLVKADLSPRYGFSLNITDIDPSFTLGELALKKKETWKRLENEGLTELNKELEVPILPFTIAVISAKGAAGYEDFMEHINQAEKELDCAFKIDLYEAPMQGDSAPEGIYSAFEQINESPRRYDVVVFIRGGGSELDLACFDDYLICKAIAECNYPVISGIGHERDNHLCDDVASVRVKTPTAAAAFLIDMIAAQKAEVEDVEKAILYIVGDKISEANLLLERLFSKLSSSSVEKINGQQLLIQELVSRLSGRYAEKMNLQQLLLQEFVSKLSSSNSERIINQYNVLEKIRSSLIFAVSNRVTIGERELSVLEQKIIASDPANILEKGYGYLDVDGSKLTNIQALKEGSRVRLKMKDGVAEFNIENLKLTLPTPQQN